TSQTGVKIERSTDNLAFTQIAVAGATAVSYADTGLAASTTYFYRVRATNAAGDSPYSNVASATTQAPPPPPPAPPPTATPTLVQHVSSSSNEQNGNTGNGFIFNLPNSTGTGNCLILAIAFDTNPASAVTVASITDSTGDTWSATADVTAGDGVNNPFTKIFVHPNPTPGLPNQTATFLTAVTPLH